jgi:ribosomal protein S18 acetylase RimI-like enzyme
MDDTPVFAGGCLCGAIRYRATSAPLRGVMCHCSMCRKQSGAPALAFVHFRRQDFEWLHGEPARYRSSEFAERGFCPSCGSTLSMHEAVLVERVQVTVGSLDAPHRVRIDDHVWTQEQIPWFRIADGLPRFAMNSSAVLQLRDARSTDVAAIAECVQAAYTPWIARIGRKPWPMLQDYAAVIRDQQVAVAEIGPEIVGVVVQAGTDEGWLVDNVAVRPDRQGQGIGRALLVHAEREAVARGHSCVYLYTNELMTENIAMYARAGYVEYERRQETGFRRVFLRKVLA